MHVELRCSHCGAQWQVDDEPAAIAPCKVCQPAVVQRAWEDLQSSLEDALAQLWLVARDAQVTITLNSASLPNAFRPPDESGL